MWESNFLSFYGVLILKYLSGGCTIFSECVYLWPFLIFFYFLLDASTIISFWGCIIFSECVNLFGSFFIYFLFSFSLSYFLYFTGSSFMLEQVKQIGWVYRVFIANRGKGRFVQKGEVKGTSKLWVR